VRFILSRCGKPTCSVTFLASYNYRVIYFFISFQRHPSKIARRFLDIFLIYKLASLLLHLQAAVYAFLHGIMLFCTTCRLWLCSYLTFVHFARLAVVFFTLAIICHICCKSAETMLPENAFRLLLGPRWCNAIDKVTNIAAISYRHLMAVLLIPWHVSDFPFAFKTSLLLNIASAFGAVTWLVKKNFRARCCRRKSSCRLSEIVVNIASSTWI